MNILVGVLTILFGGLHAIAAAAKLRTTQGSGNDIIMLVGAIAVLIAGIASCFAMSKDWIPALPGMLLIAIAAICNGLQSNFHIHHHIIRIAISAALLVGLLLT